MVLNWIQNEILFTRNLTLAILISLLLLTTCNAFFTKCDENAVTARVTTSLSTFTFDHLSNSLSNVITSISQDICADEKQIKYQHKIIICYEETYYETSQIQFKTLETNIVSGETSLLTAPYVVGLLHSNLRQVSKAINATSAHFASSSQCLSTSSAAAIDLQVFNASLSMKNHFKSYSFLHETSSGLMFAASYRNMSESSSVSPPSFTVCELFLSGGCDTANITLSFIETDALLSSSLDFSKRFDQVPNHVLAFLPFSKLLRRPYDFSVKSRVARSLFFVFTVPLDSIPTSTGSSTSVTSETPTSVTPADVPSTTVLENTTLSTTTSDNTTLSSTTSDSTTTTVVPPVLVVVPFWVWIIIGVLAFLFLLLLIFLICICIKCKKPASSSKEVQIPSSIISRTPSPSSSSSSRLSSNSSSSTSSRRSSDLSSRRSLSSSRPSLISSRPSTPRHVISPPQPSPSPLLPERLFRPPNFDRRTSKVSPIIPSPVVIDPPSTRPTQEFFVPSTPIPLGDPSGISMPPTHGKNFKLPPLREVPPASGPLFFNPKL